MLALSIALLVYPGIGTALLLGLLYRALVRGRARGGAGALAALNGREGLAALSSMLLAGLALAALPWPLHPVPPAQSWLWAWAGFELAFLLPLLPPLLAGAPRVVRSAIREAQSGAWARALLWAALAVALTLHSDWRPVALPAHLLALVAGLALLPAALGWGPFAAETSIAPLGSAAGLPDGARSLDNLARDVRAGALIAAVAIATLPVAVGPASTGLAVAGGGFLVGALALRRLEGRLPRLALPAAVRFSWLVGAPLAVAATIALVLAASSGAS